MVRTRTLSLLMFIVSVLALTGCLEGDGPTLFNETEEPQTPMVLETEADVEYPDSTFGLLTEGTQCVKQLHGGCVPSDGAWLFPSVIDYSFAYPKSWSLMNSDENEVVFTPAEDQFVKLYFWKATTVNTNFESVKGEPLDAGTGQIGPFAVVWETYSGAWSEQEVQSEWITLTADPNDDSLNYVLFLLTTPERFDEDQKVLNMVVSSLLVQATPQEEVVAEEEVITEGEASVEEVAAEEEAVVEEAVPVEDEAAVGDETVVDEEAELTSGEEEIPATEQPGGDTEGTVE